MNEKSKSAHARLYEAIEELIEYKTYVSGMVIDPYPKKYVFVSDLKRVLAANKPTDDKEPA